MSQEKNLPFEKGETLDVDGDPAVVSSIEWDTWYDDKGQEDGQFILLTLALDVMEQVDPRAGESQYYSSQFFSDDEGKTWFNFNTNKPAQIERLD